MTWGGAGFGWHRPFVWRGLGSPRRVLAAEARSEPPQGGLGIAWGQGNGLPRMAKEPSGWCLPPRAARTDADGADEQGNIARAYPPRGSDGHKARQTPDAHAPTSLATGEAQAQAAV